ncbi:hypothetical protein G210_0309, partial [Candida maltosa Xu316]
LLPSGETNTVYVLHPGAVLEESTDTESISTATDSPIETASNDVGVSTNAGDTNAGDTNTAGDTTNGVSTNTEDTALTSEPALTNTVQTSNNEQSYTTDSTGTLPTTVTNSGIGEPDTESTTTNELPTTNGNAIPEASNSPTTSSLLIISSSSFTRYLNTTRSRSRTSDDVTLDGASVAGGVGGAGDTTDVGLQTDQTIGSSSTLDYSTLKTGVGVTSDIGLGTSLTQSKYLTTPSVGNSPDVTSLIDPTATSLGGSLGTPSTAELSPSQTQIASSSVINSPGSGVANNGTPGTTQPTGVETHQSDNVGNTKPGSENAIGDGLFTRPTTQATSNTGSSDTPTNTGSNNSPTNTVPNDTPPYTGPNGTPSYTTDNSAPEIANSINAPPETGPTTLGISSSLVLSDSQTQPDLQTLPGSQTPSGSQISSGLETLPGSQLSHGSQLSTSTHLSSGLQTLYSEIDPSSSMILTSDAQNTFASDNLTPISTLTPNPISIHEGSGSLVQYSNWLIASVSVLIFVI